MNFSKQILVVLATTSLSAPVFAGSLSAPITEPVVEVVEAPAALAGGANLKGVVVPLLALAAVAALVASNDTGGSSAASGGTGDVATDDSIPFSSVK